VLFCDLVGSTFLSHQVDPEDYADIIRAYHVACAAVIERFEGHIAQYLGDGLLVYFGYPRAHEDDALRAVHTALGILESLDQLNGRLQSTYGVQVAVRIGVHTGLVVVSAVGTGGHAGPLALGDTPNIAARLQDAAAANTAVLSTATYRLVYGHFVCQFLGAQSLPGLAEPIDVYHALRARGLPSRFAAAMTHGLTPLVGRQRERDLLLERWAQAMAGSGHVVLISGEVGIGKSRLVQFLKEQVGAEPHTLLECQGLPYHQHTAFWPLTELLPRIFQWQQDEPTAGKLAKIAHVSEQMRLPVEQTVPIFASLLALPLLEDTYAPPALPPGHWRQKIFETLLTLVLELATHHPVLFIVEDLHWIDPSTLAFLELLINQSPTAALFPVITCRPTVQPSWVMRAHVTHVTLGRLGPALVQEMIGLVMREHEIPATVRQQIVAITDGVPLFVEEVTKMVLETDGQLEGTRDATRGEQPLTLTIPATLRDLLMARLDRLDTAKDVAQLASTIGREFTYDLLQALAPWDESTLRCELGHLVEAELLYQQGLPPRATYLFKHAMIRDVAYDSLLRRTRQHYHQKIAQVLEERFPETAATQPELLAYHFSLNDAWDRAFAYLVRSGDKARHVHASQEAMTFYTQAIEASTRITPALDAAQLLPAYEGRGLVWMLLTKYEAALADFEMMRQMAHASGNRHKEGESLGHLAYVHWLTFSEAHLPPLAQYAQEALQLARQTGDHKTLARSLINLGSVDQVRGQMREAERKFTEALHISRRERYQDSLAHALVFLCMQASLQGKFHTAMQLGQEGVIVSGAIHDGFTELRTLAFLCQASWGAGHYAQALTWLHEGMTKAKERQNTFFVGRLTNTLGWFSREFGALSQAVEFDHESLDIGRTAGIANVEISALINLGLDYLALGRYERALASLKPTLERVQHEAFGVHKWRWKMRLLTGLAELAYTTGAYEQALRYVEEGLQEALATASQKYVALGWALHGKIAVQLGDAETAGTELQRALSLVDALQSPSLIYPVAYDLGCWYASIGKESEAITLYRKAHATIEQMLTAVEDVALCTAFRQSAPVQAINERIIHLASS
jgi:class 3 adenylate cyclase/tetratricopeptide (TPR) repeat protein